eukprot:3285708-Amphidinium_carterae.1
MKMEQAGVKLKAQVEIAHKHETTLQTVEGVGLMSWRPALHLNIPSLGVDALNTPGLGSLLSIYKSSPPKDIPKTSLKLHRFTCWKVFWWSPIRNQNVSNRNGLHHSGKC